MFHRQKFFFQVSQSLNLPSLHRVMKASRCVLGGFRLPTERTWSKQHPKIRTPRPLVDRFNLGRMHPHKEWWRERRLAPATFMGFPDVTKAELRGYNLYTEQMDAATLAVIVDKCIVEKIFNEEFWGKFSWRTQQIINKINETEICYLFRSFSRRDWIDSHLILSLWGRSDLLLSKIGLEDASVLLEGYMNPNYFNANYEKKVLDHLETLVTVRTDWTVNELMKLGSVLGRIPTACETESLEKRKNILSLVINQVTTKSGDLFDIPAVVIANTLASLSSLGLLSESRFFLVLIEELRESGKLTTKPEDHHYDTCVIVLKALLQSGASDMCNDFVSELVIEYYDNIYRLTHSSLIDAVGISSYLSTTVLPRDHLEVLLLRVSREIYKMDKRDVCELLEKNLHLESSDLSLHKTCVDECVNRLVETGVEGVHNLSELKTAIAIAPPHIQSDSLSKLGQLVELVM